MTAFLDRVNRGEIEGINKEMLDRAYQAMDNPADPRKEQICICLTQLMVHLLEDPDRIKSAEFKLVAHQFVVLDGQYKALNANYDALKRENAQVNEKNKAQQKVIDGLIEQLAKERARSRVLEANFAQREYKRLESMHTRDGIFFSTVIIATLPLSWWMVKGLSKEQQELSGRANKWRRVESLIREKKLMLEEAKAREGLVS